MLVSLSLQSFSSFMNVKPCSGGSECLLMLRLSSTTGPVTLISMYAQNCPPHWTHVLQEPCTHHQEYPQLGTNCSSGWLQRHSGRRSWLVALLPGSIRSGQNEWKRTATAGAMHLSWPVHYELLLPHQASTQGFVETPTLTALASKLHDWFEAKSTVMTPVIEAKRAALSE